MSEKFRIYRIAHNITNEVEEYSLPQLISLTKLQLKGFYITEFSLIELWYLRRAVEQCAELGEINSEAFLAGELSGWNFPIVWVEASYLWFNLAYGFDIASLTAPPKSAQDYFFQIHWWKRCFPCDREESHLI